MAVQTPSNSPYRHIVGDLSVRFFNLTSVGNNDTLTVAGVSDILDVIITPNTTAGAAYAPAATWSGNVVTFLSGGAWGGTVAVVSRVG